MRSFLKASLPMAVFMLLLASCGQVPFSRLAGSQTVAEVGWDSRESSDGRSIAERAYEASRAVSTAADVQAWYDSYYQSLGNKLFSATPVEFSFTSPVVRLSNPNTYYDFGFYDEQTDFADPSSARRQISIQRTFYDSLYLQFVSRAQELTNNGANPRPYAPAVIVTLPGYTDVELPDIGPSFGTFLGTAFYERKYLGDNQFVFTYGELQADLSPFYGYPTDEQFPEYIIVTANVDTLALVVPGKALHSTSDYTLNTDYESTTDRPFVLVPWDGVYVDPMQEKATLTLTLDIDEIVEVYDNGTPLDKSDDHVVLANRFWERFGISVD